MPEGTPQPAIIRSLRQICYETLVSMNFLRDRKLARRLKNNEVSSKEQFAYYLILNILLTALMTSVFSSGDRHLNVYDYIMDAMSIIFIIGIVFLSYIANNKGDKKDFVMRAICISFPILLQTLIIGLITMTGVGLLMDDHLISCNHPNLKDHILCDEPHITSRRIGIDRAVLISTTILYAYYTWRTYTAMLIASGVKE